MKSAYCIRIEPTDESGRLKWQLITGQCASYSFYCKNHLRWKFNGYILYLLLVQVDGCGYAGLWRRYRQFRQLPADHSIHRWSVRQVCTVPFFYFFLRARVCRPLVRLCRPFMIFEGWLDSNPEFCRSKLARYRLSHPSPSVFTSAGKTEFLKVKSCYDHQCCGSGVPEPVLFDSWICIRDRFFLGLGSSPKYFLRAQ